FMPNSSTCVGYPRSVGDSTASNANCKHRLPPQILRFIIHRVVGIGMQKRLFFGRRQAIDTEMKHMLLCPLRDGEAHGLAVVADLDRCDGVLLAVDFRRAVG